MPSATMTSKGQVTIPRQVRDALHLRPHDKVIMTIEGKEIILKKFCPKPR